MVSTIIVAWDIAESDHAGRLSELAQSQEQALGDDWVVITTFQGDLIAVRQFEDFDVNQAISTLGSNQWDQRSRVRLLYRFISAANFSVTGI